MRILTKIAFLKINQLFVPLSLFTFFRHFVININTQNYVAGHILKTTKTEKNN